MRKGNTEAQEWVFEYNFGNEEQPKGPFTVQKLEFKGDTFSGEGTEDGEKYKFVGYINSKNKFEITQEYASNRHSDYNKIIKG